MLQKTVFNCFSPDFIFLYIYAYLEKLGKTGGDFLPGKKKKKDLKFYLSNSLQVHIFHYIENQ